MRTSKSFLLVEKKKKEKKEGKATSILKDVWKKRQYQNSEFFTCLAALVTGQNSVTGEVLLQGLQVEVFVSIQNYYICV